MGTYFLRFLLVLFVGSLAAQSQQQNDCEQEIKIHRDSILQLFTDSVRSPLHKSAIKSFSGQRYFEPDCSYKVVAKFRKEIGTPFQMKTSSEKTKLYRKFGTVQFELHDSMHVLNVYQRAIYNKFPSDESTKYLFLPFFDLTTGHECYETGRYLELKFPKSDTVYLDFNYCFNPYCSYSDGFSCPIPPRENFLNCRVEAGEKRYLKQK